MASPPPGPDERLGLGPLKGTIRGDRAELLALLVEFLGDALPMGFGNAWYGEGVKLGQLGSRLYWAPRLAGEHRRTEVLFEITQSACDALGFERTRELARRLAAFSPHWTRLDVHWDDRAVHQTPRGAIEAFKQGQYLGRVKKWSFWEDGDGGETAYIGSRQSGQLLRIYNADPLHGEGTGVRWELEAHRDHAGELVERLLLRQDDTPLGDVFWATVRGVVDFVDRPKGADHGERFAPLAWWATLTANVPRVPIKLARFPQLLEAKLQWLARGVAPSLALILAAITGDNGQDGRVAQVRRVRYLRQLVQDGAERLTADSLGLLPPGRRPTVRLLARAGSGAL
jgi:hypothetical protein